MDYWKDEMLRLVVLYRMLECGDKIPINTTGTEYSFIEEVLDDLYKLELLRISDDDMFWEVTQKGLDLRDKMVGMYDHVLKFEIFGNVNLSCELTNDESSDGFAVFDHMYDPRFSEPKNDSQIDKWESEDMRIAMMDFLSTEMGKINEWKGNVGHGIDPHRIVFIQMLADGKLRGDIWFDLRLGSFFRHVEDVVSHTFKWIDLGDGATEVMKELYTAGMLEQRKRDGCECSGCGIPLAVFEFNTKEDGQELSECPNPNCRASFSPPEPEGDPYECPNCGYGVGTKDHLCRGCGAILDFSKPERIISTEMVEETVIEEGLVWRTYGGYVPYGYYYPYNPFYDMVGFACLCDVLW